MTEMYAAILKFPGTNCDGDVAKALNSIPGTRCEIVWHAEFRPKDYDLVVLPGGFSYSDRLRAGAIAAKAKAVESLKDFVDDGGLVLGICNGFQILVEAGMLPGALLPNMTTRFICKWVNLRVENAETPFTNLFEEGQIVKMPIAHNEGRYVCGEAYDALKANRLVAFTYVDESGRKTKQANPNGSERSIAGIVNEKLNVLGLMPHPERACKALLSPFGTDHGRLLFLSILNYLK